MSHPLQELLKIDSQHSLFPKVKATQASGLTFSKSTQGNKQHSSQYWPRSGPPKAGWGQGLTPGSEERIGEDLESSSLTADADIEPACAGHHCFLCL